MENELFSSWCTEATRLILFRPDRQAVYQELMAHLEDSQIQLQEQGMDRQAAYREALRAMGSAEEVASQLAAVHRPYWGWLHRITRVACALLCLITVFALGIQISTWIRFASAGKEQTVFLAPDRGDHWECVETLYPRASAYIDGYFLRVPAAKLYSHTEHGRWLCLNLETFYLPIQGELNAKYSFWATDSLGNRYPCYTGLEADPYGRYLRVDSWLYSTTGASRTAAFITGIPSADVQWVEIHYDRDGRDMSLRIFLTGGEHP